jgi:glycosyltransferase involved in cell wall biosynthesis
MENAMVHHAGDVDTLADHLSNLDQDRDLLNRLRNASLATAHELTWRAAGTKLLSQYRALLAGRQHSGKGHEQAAAYA